jgi:hemerythrin-like domain-containing protein
VLIGELQAMREVNEQYEAKFTVLIENVEHHIEEEEKEMLPDAKETLGEDTKVLGKQMEERKQALMAAAR